jgi:hypothetical protein
MSMKMSSTIASDVVCKNSWADIVKGKEVSAFPTKQKKKFNATASEFVPRKKAANTPSAEQKQFNFSTEAPEFVPPVTEGLSPSTKEFFPTQHRLLNKAAEMQKLLLECYTDDDDTSDDEPRCLPASKVQKRKQATMRSTGIVVPFRPPPGLAPPDASLNPFAEAFDPSTCFADGKIANPAPALTNAINIAGFYSEDEDDESPVSTPRGFSKMDQTSAHDSTSAGESSDSETESWSGPHSP